MTATRRATQGAHERQTMARDGDADRRKRRTGDEIHETATGRETALRRHRRDNDRRGGAGPKKATRREREKTEQPTTTREDEDGTTNERRSYCDSRQDDVGDDERNTKTRRHDEECEDNKCDAQKMTTAAIRPMQRVTAVSEICDRKRGIQQTRTALQGHSASYRTRDKRTRPASVVKKGKQRSTAHREILSGTPPE